MEDGVNSSSTNSLVDDHQNKADDEDGLDGDHHTTGKVQQPEASASIDEPFFEELSQISYKGYIIRVFSDIHSPRKHPRRFYFEPAVFLVPESIASESNELLKKNLVRFKIQMWDAEIRSKVLEQLRSLPSLTNVEIRLEDVRVLPYKEVQLVVKPGSLDKSNIRLPDEATSYRRLDESLDFFFLCDLPTVAEALADNLKRNPDVIVRMWNLALECRGLAVANGVVESLDKMSSKDSTYKVSTLQLSIDATDQNAAITKEETYYALVFHVKEVTNPRASECFIGFSTDLFDTKTEHGDFHLPSGVFTVKTGGIYQLCFTADVQIAVDGLLYNEFLLNVNDEARASSCNYSTVEGDQRSVIAVSLPLKSGDQVGVFTNISSGDKMNDAQFFGILFSDK